MRLMVIVLAGVSLAAALASGATPAGDSDKTQRQKASADDLVRRFVLPEAAAGVYVPVQANGVAYEKGYAKADTTGLVGYTVKAVARGYSSRIETVVGVDTTGRITGLKITSHQETPGLGARISEVKPSKSVLDALGVGPGTPGSRKLAVQMEGYASGRPLVVELRNTEALGKLERAVAAHDTSRVVQGAPAAIAVSGDQAILSDSSLTYRLAETVIKRLRDDPMPWWQIQFLGKSRAELVLAKEKSDKSIQAITGATVSSKAVTESIRNAMAQLEQAIGGFKGGGK